MLLIFKLITKEELKFQLGDGSYSIGRSSECDIVIKHDGVSRKHCRIDIINDELFITDFGSTNGVMVDDHRIEPNIRTELKTYLNLTFGPVISFKALTDEEVAQNLLSLNTPNLDTSSLTRTTPLKTADQLLNPSPIFSRKNSNEKALRLKIIIYNLIAAFFLCAVAFWYLKRETPPVKYDLTPKKAKPQKIKKEDEIFN